MSLSGIYAAEFHSALGAGTGVAIFTDNTIHGGDSSHFYQGKYSLRDPDRVMASIEVSQHAAGKSVVGLNQFRLELTGKVIESGTQVRFTLEGSVQGDSSKRISINLNKLADLVQTYN